MRPASRTPYANITFRGVGGKSMYRPRPGSHSAPGR